MTIGEVKALYEDKEQIPCPLTEKLVKAGYQQISGGYIDRAQWRGVKVSYKENSPSQYLMSRDWHLPSLPNLGGIVKEVPDIAPRSASNRPEKCHISPREVPHIEARAGG